MIRNARAAVVGVTAAVAFAMGMTAVSVAPAVAQPPTQGGGTLMLGDDTTTQLALPFTFKICGQEFDSVWVNSNGNLTFGSGDTAFTETVPAFLNNQPRVAGLWDDLNPAQGGTVSYSFTGNEFVVQFENVPKFFNTGANTFAMTLRRSSNQIDIKYGELSDEDGIAGVSCGGTITDGTETETNLNPTPNSATHNMQGLTAFFEDFEPSSDPVDLDGYRLRFTNH